MTSASDGRSNSRTRTYDRADSVVFRKTKEAFGGLSNMAGGFPLNINGIRIRTSEALYQACRFPRLPHVQKLIIAQKSPMTAKMKGKPHRRNSRPDWERVQVRVMRWCLRVKLAQNWTSFSRLLLETGARPIVEESPRDAFWGAKPVDEQKLVGMNVLGRLLMELREEVKRRDRASLLRVEPLGISNFRLYGRQIQPVEAGGVAEAVKAAAWHQRPAPTPAPAVIRVQASLFDQPSLNADTEPWRRAVEQPERSVDDLKPYPAMKDSGLPWLREVPEHWDVRRGKSIFRCIDVRSQTGEEELLTVSSERGVVPRRSANVTMFKAESYIGHKLCWPGDLVINSLWAWARGLGVSSYHGIVSTAYGVYRPKKTVEPEFIHDFVRSTPFHWELRVRSKGVWTSRLQLTDGAFLDAPFPLPPLEEQAAIVRYLEYMDRRIRRYIRAKQKLIKLLEEQKQAIIHRAVTRGLDPDVPLKPSGVEWLGDVPEHWEVRRIGDSVADCITGAWGSEPNGVDDLPCVRVADFDRQRLRVRMQKPTIRAIAHTERRRRILKSGDLLLEKSGGGDQQPVGVVMLYDHEVPAVCSNFVARMPVKKAFDSSFLTFLHSALYAIGLSMKSIKQTTGIQNLDSSAYLGELVRFPPLPEQRAIAEHLGKATADLDTAIDRARREIELLREYRTRLIADVVTGKLDVREAAASLPDEPHQPEPAAEADDLMDEGDAMADGLDAAPDEAEDASE